MLLRELQHQWCRHILEGDEAIVEHIHSPQDFNGVQRLHIYRGGYVGALLNALREIYPVCFKIVGESFFEAMAERFIRNHPSFAPDLYEYGSEFAGFIAQFPPTASLPYLADVAQLEWDYHQAFLGPDNQELDLPSLVQLDPNDWAGIRFQLQPYSFLRSSLYPIHRIWQMNQPEASDEEYVDLDEGGVHLLIWRQGLDMHLDILDPEEWFLLHQFAAGLPFEQACARCLEEKISDIQSLLLKILGRGWLGSWRLEPGNEALPNPASLPLRDPASLG